MAESSEPPANQAAAQAADPASTQATVVVSDPGASTGTVSSTNTVKPLPFNCQAPLVAIEEITRFLTVTATHATASSSCVDGPGRRVSIDEILVCPMALTGSPRPFAATYRVTTWPEGGRQVCAGKCPPVKPEVSQQRIELTFKEDKGSFILELPSTVPGMPLDAVPAGKEHDGDCYGKSPAFVSQPVVLTKR